MISVDAGDADWSAFPDNQELLALKFGLFDDSFNHAKHAKENEPNWNTLGRNRWQHSPTGGEFSFFQKATNQKRWQQRDRTVFHSKPKRQNSRSLS